MELLSKIEEIILDELNLKEHSVTDVYKVGEKIQALLEINSELEMRKWVKIEPGCELPEKERGQRFSIDILITDGHDIDKGFYNYQTLQWTSYHTQSFINVTHWQPLPELP